MPDLAVQQWGRLGDLLQTRIVLHRWKRQHGSSRISLFFDQRYTELVRRFPEVDDLVPLDLQRFTGLSRHSASHDTLFSELRRFVETQQEKFHDTSLVLSRSVPAVIVSELLNHERSLGFRRSEGRIRAPSGLDRFASVKDNESRIPVHICDVWTATAELPATAISIPLLKDTAQEPHSPRNRIAVIADAGESGRTPPVSWLAELCESLSVYLGRPLVIIGKSRYEQTDPISRLAKEKSLNITDKRGQTSLSELTDILGQCKTVIGPDTGALHLAAAVGCRTLGLYFGGALTVQTGPYAENAAVVHNPQWGREDIQRILSEIAGGRYPSSRISSRMDAREWWRPVCDEYGLCYLPNHAQNTELKNVRDARASFMNEYYRNREPAFTK